MAFDDLFRGSEHMCQRVSYIYNTQIISASPLKEKPERLYFQICTLTKQVRNFFQHKHRKRIQKVYENRTNTSQQKHENNY